MRHRTANALWADDAIELHPSANIGVGSQSRPAS
jgi:hypothetical protein